jgi:hypothetical protein
MKKKTINPWEFDVDVNGNAINFGFDGISTAVLFGGSFTIDYKKPMTLQEVKEDIIKNYDEYKLDDEIFFRKANGFYD